MTTPETKEFDPFESAFNPVVQTYDLFGKVEINAWACALVKGQGKVPFDPNNPTHKRFTAIDIFIEPLPEIDVKYPKSLEEHWIGEFPEWAKITLPSIRAAGIENGREVNGKYARIARVPNGKTYVNKDGETKNETTFKFIEFYRDEAECRAMYLANGGQPSNGHVSSNAPVSTPEEQEKATAYQFLKVIVPNAARGKENTEAATAAVALALAGYPTVAKHYTVDSPEVLDLISTVVLPF